MNTLIKASTGLTLFLFFILSAPRPALAEESDLKVFITPYAWLISVSGDVEAKGYTAQVDAPFTTLTRHINFAGMLAVDILAYDRFGFTGNINVAMLGDNSSLKGISLDSESSMILSDLALFYRLGSTPLNESESVYVIWDVYGGARIWDLRAKLDVNHPRQRFSVSQHETWVDPIIGAKAWVHLPEGWSLELRGDIGGFDVSSKMTWSASSILGYSLWDDGRLLLGYRAAGVDYEKGSGANHFRADAVLHGPIVGLSFRF